MSASPTDSSQQLLRLRASGVLEIRDSMSLEDIARASCRHWLVTLIEHAPAVRRGDDVEALHEMRVAARRLEATIRLFRDHLPAWAYDSRDILRSLMRVLGATRDIDVQLEFIRARIAECGNGEQALLEPLETRLRSDRTRAQGRLLKALDALRTQEWLNRWIEHLSAANESNPPCEKPIVDFALAGIRSRYKRVRKAAERLNTASSPEEYHEVRGRVKRLRYTLETFAPLCGKELSAFLGAVVRLQDVLGKYQDAHVRAARLQVLAESRSHPLPAPTLLFMGRLMERDARRGRKARLRVSKVYQRIRGRRWKALRRSLLSEQGSNHCSAQRTPDTAETAASDSFIAHGHNEARA